MSTPQDQDQGAVPVDQDATDYAMRVPGRTPEQTPAVERSGGLVNRRLPRRFGDYELLEEIARGGMGVVYKARQAIGDGERVVALKMMLAGGQAPPEAVERFLLEARAAAALEHPHIVPIYDVGAADGQHYFTMQLVSGGSLHQLLARGPLPPREAARIVARVADAAQCAHDHNLIHRDIKPHNILLASGERQPPESAAHSGGLRPPLAAGTPKLTDFGLVRTRASGLSITGEAMGTPSYMPPEQARGQLDRIGPPSDVYGLGAVLYALLTGRPPFQSADHYQTMKQVCEQEPLPPRQLNPAVPRDLETICLKCLQKEPNRRYPSARELAEELERFLAGAPVRARPVSRPERCWRWCKRNPVVAGLLAGIVAVLLAGTAVATHFAIQAGTRAREAENARDTAATRATEAEHARREAEAARTTAERSLFQVYQGTLAQAQRDWKADRPGSAEQRLDEAPPEPRRWEWHYLKRLLHADLLTLRGHTKLVNAVAYSPDGRWLASGSGNANDRGQETVKIWDAATGDQRFTLAGHDGPVTWVAFSPDSKHVASASLDRTVRVWDVASGQEVFRCLGHAGGVIGLAFSPDGKHLATASEDRTLRVWDAATGTRERTLCCKTAVFAVAFAPDGAHLASAGADGIVRLWDARTGKEVLACEGHAGAVLSVVYSPDGRRLASADRRGEIKLWDAATGREVADFDGKEGGYRVAFSPDGKRLATAVGDAVTVRDARSGKELFALRGHRSVVQAVAYSPDGRRLASASWDRTIKVWDAVTAGQPLTLGGHGCIACGGRILAACGPGKTCVVWNAHSGKRMHTFAGHTESVLGVACSRDGQLLASASRDRTVKVWDLARGKETLTFSGHTGAVLRVAFSPDGRRIASAGEDKMVRLWETASGRQLWAHELNAVAACLAFDPAGRTLAVAEGNAVRLWDPATGRAAREPLGGHRDRVNGLAFSPDGRLLASASEDATVKLWELPRGRELRTLFHQRGGVRAVAFSPDGQRLATLGFEVRLWDVGLGLPVLALPTEAGADVAFSPDGRQLAVAGERVDLPEGSLKVWDGMPGRECLVLRDRSAAVAFHPDGRRLATAGYDTTVKVWDARTGARLLQLQGHSDVVRGVAFSPDGRWLASAADDKTVRLWDAATGQHVRTLLGHTDAVRALAFSADGQLLATAGEDRTVRVWKMREGNVLQVLKGHDDGVLSVSFGPGGQFLASAGEDGRVIVWDVASGRKVREVTEFPEGAAGVAFSPDGLRLAAAAGKEVRLWDTRSWKEQCRLEGHSERIRAIAFSPDGEQLASAGVDQVVKLWDAKGHELLALRGHTAAVVAVAFSPDGSKLATVDDDSDAVRLWNVEFPR